MGTERRLDRLRASVARDAVAAILPFGAAVLQWVAWPVIQPFVWFLFFPAVFLSSRIGGVLGGLAATAVSTLLVIFVFMPPQLSWTVADPDNVYSVGMFGVMGILFTLTHHRLKVATKTAANALDAAREANTQLQSANEQVTRLYERARELDELKTQLFANVSHELRTPLTLILGPISRRLADPGLDAGTRSDLEVVARNARMLHRHVDDLLDLSRLEAKRMQVHYSNVDVGHVVRFAASHFELLAAERQIRLSVDAPESVPAQADPALCQRTLVNLLSNAFKFTPDGGAVTAAVVAGLTHVEIVVRDTGPGVPADKRDAIFETFRQLDGGASRQHAGTGLGLAIVRHVVVLHGGHVRVEDNPGGGACFVVSLPLRAPDGVEVLAGAIQLDAGHGRQAAAELGTIPARETPAVPAPAAPLALVVEDNAEMRDFVAEVLGDVCRVALARDGREGLAQALELHPDLIITDVMMPGMSGNLMVETLRQDHTFDDVPVVVLTAKADERLQVEMLAGGVQDYLRKPFEPEELRARVSRLLSDRRRALAQTEETLRHLYDQARQDAEAKGRLLTEVNHRVKNNLLAIQGLLLFERSRGAATRHPEAGASIERLAQRIDGLVAVHELLTQSEWAPLRATDLCVRVVERAVGSVGERVLVDIPAADVIVSPRQASSLAFVLNELATNSLKHAGLAERRGRISARAAVDGATCVIEYRDDGPGYPAETIAGGSRSVGLSLVTELVTGTLRGTVALDNDAGAVVRLRIPMEEPDRT